MIEGENWHIEDIKRFGIFGKDPRYSDELLISELSGLDGNSENAFFRVSESTQTEKIKDLRENCWYSLEQSTVWKETIAAIFDELASDRRRYRVTLRIYNPDSLMVSIYHTVSKKELNYLPAYFLRRLFRGIFVGALSRRDQLEFKYARIHILKAISEKMKMVLAFFNCTSTRTMFRMQRIWHWVTRLQNMS